MHMNSSVAALHIGAIRSAYPMLRGSGTFLVCIGLGLVCAIAFSGPALINYTIFYTGAGLGVAALFGSRRLSKVRPSRVQILALCAAVLLELVLIIASARVLPHGTPEQVRWLWVSIIVGVHFVPMAVAFGPRMLVLGLLCIGNGAAGLLVPHVPYEYFGVFDGLLKISFGVWSLAGKA